MILNNDSTNYPGRNNKLTLKIIFKNCSVTEFNGMYHNDKIISLPITLCYRIILDLNNKLYFDMVSGLAV